MIHFRRISLLLIAPILVTFTYAATAQQVLVCVSLHADLVNFDRRAALAWDKIDAPKIAQAATDREHIAGCVAGNVFARNCEALAITGPTVVDSTDRTFSRLGGRDPIRLKIIAEMRANGCTPIETFATDYFYETIPPDHLPPPARPIPQSQIVRARY